MARNEVLEMEAEFDRMDEASLRDSIISTVTLLGIGTDTTRLNKAIDLATRLHEKDVRDGEPGGVRPYIVHPLRNTLRLLKMGTTDEGLLIAAVLHDTVEDHPFEIVQIMQATSSDPFHARELSLQYLSEQFGEEVAFIVEGMSNPLVRDPIASREQRNRVYAEHVQQATQDPQVFACKVADFIDNAVGLVRNQQHTKQDALERRATKYLPVVDVLEARLDQGLADDNLPISLAGADMVKQLFSFGREGLRKIINNA